MYVANFVGIDRVVVFPALHTEILKELLFEPREP